MQSMEFDAASLTSPTGSKRRTFSRRSRPSSIFGSIRSISSWDADSPSSRAASSKAPSVSWDEDYQGHARGGQVILHGEVQTSSGIIFKKRREYIVLTETSLLRYKNQTRASEVHAAIPPAHAVKKSMLHSSMSSVGSAQDIQSLFSSSSGERDVALPLHQVVAVYRLADGRPSHTIDVAYLDNEQLQPSVLTLTFTNTKDGNTWTAAIRNAAHDAGLSDLDHLPLLPHQLSHHIQKALERDHDYDPAQFKVYRVMHRPVVKSSGRFGSDDTVNEFSSAICLLAFGIYKLHLIQIPKSTIRAGSLIIDSSMVKQSFGYLALQALSVDSEDGSFKLTFRKPFHQATAIRLTSLASEEIIDRLRQTDATLRPLWPRCPFIHGPYIDREVPSPDSLEPLSYAAFDRTLAAFCVAYGVDPSNICYTTYDDVEDGPCFALLEPANQQSQSYTYLELLAIMRGLRYNECFVTVCFAGISLEGLEASYDYFGGESICLKSRLGMRLHVGHESLNGSSVLIQEVQALALSSRTLKKLDFSGCSANKPSAMTDTAGSDVGRGILEALCFACRNTDTNIDWLVLNGIQLGEAAIEHLVDFMATMSGCLRAVELNRCGLNDRTLALLLDTLAGHSRTLQTLSISGNFARLHASIFNGQVSAFHRLRSLDLSDLSFVADSDPLISAEVLSTWPLERLILSGVVLNPATIESLASYLSSRPSETLLELKVDRCRLTGSDVAKLFYSMTWNTQVRPELHLDVSENDIERGHDAVVSAISSGSAPSHLSIRGVVHDGQDLLRKLAIAMTANQTIKYLDISMASLPGELTASTAEALERMFSENDTLEVLDISGEDSRTGLSSFGDEFNQALKGLKRNRALKILSINNQKLGLRGAGTLADILKENATLRELHCENNDMRLHGFTDLIDSLEYNTTLLYLAGFALCREKQLKGAAVEYGISRKSASSSAGLGLFSMRRTIASIGVKSAKPTPLPIGPTGGSPVLRELNEGWDKQARRLDEILARNANIANDSFAPAQTAQVQDDRPSTADGGSFTDFFETLHFESTPTLESMLHLGDPTFGGYDQLAMPLSSLDTESDSIALPSYSSAQSPHGASHLQADNTEATPSSGLRPMGTEWNPRRRSNTSVSSSTVLAAAVNEALLEAMGTAVTSPNDNIPAAHKDRKY